MGQVINFIQPKTVQDWPKILENVLGHYEMLHSVYRQLAGAST